MGDRVPSGVGLADGCILGLMDGRLDGGSDVATRSTHSSHAFGHAFLTRIFFL